MAFWSEAESAYVCYFRTWSQGDYQGFRTTSRATSGDFLNWNEPVSMRFGDTPMEHLYTSQTHPYFRAPHIYVATPMRFIPGRKVLTDAQATAVGIVPTAADEMSIYKQAHYAQPTAHLARYTLRLDGFVSVNAPFAGGQMTTRPFRFHGRDLTLNLSTSAAGSVRVVLLDGEGEPIPGFGRPEAVELIGDDLDRVVG